MRILGLDIGTSSIGWSILEWPESGESGLSAVPQVVDCGVRIFPEGVGSTSSGAEESLGAQRRAKRQQRRQIDRRRRRRLKLFNKLCYLGLLPEKELSESPKAEGIRSEERPKYFAELDQTLVVKWQQACALDPALWSYLDLDASGKKSKDRDDDRQHRLTLRLPYLLRALAAERHLDPVDLGRALLNLGARRGYQSNRKSAQSEEATETSDLLRGQANLEVTLAQKKQTLGQYLAKLTPTEDRLRNHPTTRRMYREEFSRIQETQIDNPKLSLTEENWREIYKIIFYQRPLKSQRHLRSPCRFEKNHTGAPRARLISQEFRVRTALINLRYRDGDGPEKSLTPDQVNACFTKIWAGENLKEARFQKTLGLKKTSRWNLDSSESRSLQAPTVAKVIAALDGDSKEGNSFWSALGSEQEAFIDTILSYEKSEALKTHLLRRYGGPAPYSQSGLSETQAERLSRLGFEDGYLSYSAKAMRKLLPYLRSGQRIDRPASGQGPSPIDLLYPAAPVAHYKLLPPAEDIVGKVRNPVVLRVLTQLRVVVNAIIERHGLPAGIRVELSREVKKTSRERAEIRRENNAREKIRAEIAARLKSTVPDFATSEPKRSDIERYLLWIECGRVCVYTGKNIELAALFSSAIEVEHIIPFSRSMDDSYANKTLCFTSENKTKGNKTPWEAYGSNEVRWGEILDRLTKWPSSKDDKLLRGYSWGAVEKLRRFREVKHPQVDDFIARQLVDTQYSTKLARRYLTCLWQEPIQVQVTNGALTSVLRRVTRIDGYLGESDSGKKSRDDHRHHVIDAMMVAMSTPSMVKALADSVSQCEAKGERYWKRLKEQLSPTFEVLSDAAARARISIHSRNRVRGSLHKDTQYGIRFIDDDHSDTRPKSRKKSDTEVLPDRTKLRKIATARSPLLPDHISKSEARMKFAENVVDQGLQSYLQKDLKTDKQLNRLGVEEDFIIGPNRKPIRRVRTEAANPESLLPVGSDENPRWLANDENHHIEIWKNAKGKWIGRVMNMLDAHKRKGHKLPVYQSKGEPGEIFIMQLNKQDLIETRPEGSADAKIWIVDGIDSSGQIILLDVFDARPRGLAKKAGAVWSPKASGLQEAKAVRIVLDPLGYLIHSDRLGSSS
jgi:CRISPR-associated endonuclease Csn1